MHKTKIKKMLVYIPETYVKGIEKYQKENLVASQTEVMRIALKKLLKKYL